MSHHWFDAASIGIVLLGTIFATVLRCGPREFREALRALRTLFEGGFDVAKAKAELAKQIRDIADDGFVRAVPRHIGDGEFDYLADVLISERSIEVIHDEHRAYKVRRTHAATQASRVFDQAAELAPVLGLVGTLVALGSGAAGSPSGQGLAEAIAMAVVTTLYGLLIANFVFSPLSAAILRRSLREENDREEVLEWLATGLKSATRISGSEIAQTQKPS